MTSPKILLLDQPMAGVNPALIEHIGGYILGRGRGAGRQPEHPSSGSTVIVLAEGRTLATGLLSELRENAEVVKAYLGEVMNAAALMACRPATAAPRSSTTSA